MVFPPNPPGDTTEARSHPQHRWLIHVATQLRSREPAFEEERNWQRVLSRVEAQSLNAWGRSARPLGRTVADWWALAIAWSFGVASTAALIFAVVPVLTTSHDESRNVVALGDATTAASSADDRAVTLQVTFKPDATVSEVTSLLQRAQAQVTGGPNAMGVWRISIPEERAQATALAWRREAMVKSVEP